MIKLNLNKNYKYLLACSFGPDSMALFHILQSNGYDFDCAIVNYHLRKESDNEVLSLIKYASNFKIKVHVLDVEESIEKNIESRCREIRYKFFKKLTDDYGYNSTLVAHNQDDLIETYLLQKERQNCPIFYGISEKTHIFGVDIQRPLLNLTKLELHKICIENHVPFSIDQTNFDTKIKRNKIRHETVSKLSASDRQALLAKIKSENDELSALFKSINIEKLCEVNYILSLDQKTLSYALNLYVKKLNPSLYLSKHNVGQIIDILKSKNSNGQYQIKTGLYLIKEYGYFFFEQSKLIDVDYEYVLEKPNILDTPYFYLDFTRDASNRNVHDSDYPLIIRHVNKKDVVTIKGYKCVARRLLIDWKVPFRKRLIWPAIVNNKGECIYIPRYQKDFRPSSDCNFYVK